MADAHDDFLLADIAHFSTPGHKRAVRHVSGALKADVPLLVGLDDQQLSSDVLGRSERLAAEAWSCDFARFSVQGASHPNLAIALATTRPGEPVIVARNSHKSVLAGLVLSGAVPVWVDSGIAPQTGIGLGVEPSSVRAALLANPDATAVWVADPTYTGVLADVESLSLLAHEAGMPLVVDQAWGAHFGFHPEFPLPATSRGADIAVISPHKTLTAFTQAAMLLLCDSGRIDRDRLGAAFDLLMTTSQSGVILASLDRTRQLMHAQGTELLDAALGLSRRLRGRLDAMDGISIADRELNSLGWSTDPLKIVIDVQDTGRTGTALSRKMVLDGVQLLMADSSHLVPLITIADDEKHIDRLADAVEHALQQVAPDPSRSTHEAHTAAAGRQIVACSPREAFQRPRRRVNIEASIGEVVAESAVPYPPGVALIAPGERMTEALLIELRRLKQVGTRVIGLSDQTLNTVLVATRQLGRS